MTTLSEFNAAMQDLLNTPLSELNAQFDQFLVELTGLRPVRRAPAPPPVNPTVWLQLTPRQRRRLKQALLHEFRKRCGVRE